MTKIITLFLLSVLIIFVPQMYLFMLILSTILTIEKVLSGEIYCICQECIKPDFEWQIIFDETEKISKNIKRIALVYGVTLFPLYYLILFIYYNRNKNKEKIK